MVRSFSLGKLNIAVAVSLVAILATITLISTDGAKAASGGIGMATPTGTVKKQSGTIAAGTRFGTRTLRQGMSGPDVKVLKSIVRSKNLLSGALTETFDQPTTSAVRRFQASANISSNGVVSPTTAKALIGSLRTSEASWYGPGLWGNGTACGEVILRPGTIGVANKNLPCGTRVLFGYRGKFIIAPVIDRGPYIAGRTWDLTKAASDAIGLTSAGVGRVRHAIISRGK